MIYDKWINSSANFRKNTEIPPKRQIPQLGSMFRSLRETVDPTR